jgi:hypothetical protein
MRYKLIITLILILPLAISCGENRSKSRYGVLSEAKMTELLVDTHLTDAILYVDQSRADEKRDKALFYYPSVLEKHGITQARMDSSVAWYMRHPEAYARIYAKVIKELEGLQTKEKEAAKNIENDSLQVAMKDSLQAVSKDSLKAVEKDSLKVDRDSLLFKGKDRTKESEKDGKESGTVKGAGPDVAESGIKTKNPE